MALVVHGFPSKATALQFEWAWQHPWKDRHIRGKISPSMGLSRGSMSGPKARLKLVKAMISLEPWRRFGLGLHFSTEEVLNIFQEVVMEFSTYMDPNAVDDAPITVGPLTDLATYSSSSSPAFRSPDSSDESDSGWDSGSDVSNSEGKQGACSICSLSLSGSAEEGPPMIRSSKCPCCSTIAHTLCWGRCFLAQEGGDAPPSVIPR